MPAAMVASPTQKAAARAFGMPAAGPAGTRGPPRAEAGVAVIGGAPVGATLALPLARAGRRVIVLKRAPLPRDKPCGEGLMPSGARVLGAAGVDLAAEGFPRVAAVRYRLDGGASVR